MIRRLSTLALVALAACGHSKALDEAASGFGAQPAGAAAAEPAPPLEGGWTARGSEPGWMLQEREGGVVLTYDYGKGTFTTASLKGTKSGDADVYKDAAGELMITVRTEVCTDSATGVPHPHQVSVTLAGRSFTGCGGDPHAVLAGDPWLVSDVNGAGMVPGAPVSLAFDAVAGRVSGKAACNRYGASYTLGGEGIAFGAAMSTKMACAPPLMALERRFLDALQAATMVAVDADGTLTLSGPDGQRIVAKR